jgi:hypothetical protein
MFNVSILTSLEPALKEGPINPVGKASVTFHVTNGVAPVASVNEINKSLLLIKFNDVSEIHL